MPFCSMGKHGVVGSRVLHNGAELFRLECQVQQSIHGPTDLIVVHT